MWSSCTEYLHATREIFTDGSPHPRRRSTSGWGIRAAAGRAIRSSSTSPIFNDQTWFDRAGNFHSDALHVVERYTRTDADHLLYEVTIEDPKVFTRPWTMRMPLYRRQESNAQLLEFECYVYARDARVLDAK